MIAMIQRMKASDEELRRWGASAALVFALHAFIVIALLYNPDLMEAEAGSPVVLMELTPVLVSPISMPHDLAPGLKQPLPASVERVQVDREPVHEKKPDEIIPPPPVVGNAPVTLPTPQPPELKTVVKQVAPAQTASKEVPVATAPPTATQSAPQAAGPAPGQTIGPSSQAIATWQRQLVAHLQKFKRYPQNAYGAQGVATVSFNIDRDGRVIESHILQSSGSAALDAEAINTIKRSEPLPRPPGNIADAQLSFAVPIRYLTTLR